ncbi:hypothetical protein DOTSEDRAFT_81365 [Dothistroma septosporum NZE10]|uniref:Tubulin-specific chaperone A n=1 Tax=Dothistroma septosporum (strain NZE10 / CBS 128990) TaxID=675120 RepID=N1PK62_DOTSN|nr:hypothetical protein DOTSEDRAFT_81365 [Dothistroma septosporum NZE10]
MPAPSQLAIATASLNRLVREEASYHKESQHQQDRIFKLETGGNGDDENAEYTLKQERKALEETKAVMPQLKQKIEEAKAKLEGQLEQDKGPGDQSSSEDITKAKQAVAAALAAIRETS